MHNSETKSQQKRQTATITPTAKSRSERATNQYGLKGIDPQVDVAKSEKSLKGTVKSMSEKSKNNDELNQKVGETIDTEKKD